MARPRKPTHLKVVSGTAQKCRLNPDEPDGAGGWPVAPARLSARAAEIFDDTCSFMSGMGTLSVEWVDVIAAYAAAQEKVEITAAILDDLGLTYITTTASGDTMIRPRPEEGMNDRAEKRAQALRSELGLGPASKSRVSAAGKKREKNPFAEFG